MASSASSTIARDKYGKPQVTLLACGPESLLARIRTRLHHPAALLCCSALDTSALSRLAPASTILLFAPPSWEASRTLQKLVQQQAHQFVEISTSDSPWATQYGFPLQVAGTTTAISTCTPILDQLAPCPDGWWHVGNIGAAAFMQKIQPDFINWQQSQAADLPQLCRNYLSFSQSEPFTAYHPERQRALAPFLDARESPARQLAQLLQLSPQHP